MNMPPNHPSKLQTWIRAYAKPLTPSRALWMRSNDGRLDFLWELSHEVEGMIEFDRNEAWPGHEDMIQTGARSSARAVVSRGELC